jgi:hypothetical protein
MIGHSGVEQIDGLFRERLFGHRMLLRPRSVEHGARSPEAQMTSRRDQLFAAM